MDWKPVYIFYAKITSWIIIPLVIALVLNRYIKAESLYFVLVMLAFGLTCYGIYGEVKKYKKTLDNGDK